MGRLTEIFGEGSKRRSLGHVDTIRKYEEGWVREMIVIWREKIEQMHVIDTGALHSSFTGSLSIGEITTAKHEFIQYGIYQASGVGRNYLKSKKSDGTLEFLDDEYRAEHGLDKPHKVGPKWGGRTSSGHPRYPSDWFYRKFYASLMTLNDAEARLYGEAYMGLLSDVIEKQFQGFAVKSK